MASSATALVTLQDLIGDTSGLVLKRGKVSVRGGLSVAYWLFSSPDPAHASKPTIVALHGGPSFTHNYILPLLLLTLEHGYPVCFYDQVRTARSGRAFASARARALTLCMRSGHARWARRASCGEHRSHCKCRILQQYCLAAGQTPSKLALCTAPPNNPCC